MSREQLLEEARAFFLEGAVDTCTIKRLNAGETTDADGVITKTYTTLYTGACRVQQQQPYAERHDVGQAYRLLLRLEVQLPMTVTGLQPDDILTMATSLTDADLPGRVFVIRDLAHKTDASSRRVQCQEITS
jgi:hypothetical protein